MTSWTDAAEAQRILAQAQPAGQAYANLAFFLYRAGDIAGGDQASAQAVQTAAPNEKAAIEQQLKQTKKQGEQLSEAIAQLQKEQQQTAQATGGATGANPLESARRRRPQRSVAPSYNSQLALSASQGR